MDTLTALGAHLCGQGRCFISDGVPLPVCQRCFGLYLGAFLTAVWLAATGAWRRGLPHRSIVALNSVMLVFALLGGLHSLDDGPGWRLLCGLWTGHVVLLWLVSGAAQVWPRALPRTHNGGTWRRAHTGQALAAPGLLALVAYGYILLPASGWYWWTALVGGGVLCLLTAAGAACAALARRGGARLRKIGGGLADAR